MLFARKFPQIRHPGESRDPSHRAKIASSFHVEPWVPAFAGMTDVISFEVIP